MAERPFSRQRPYLLRAMHEWMTDNSLTPHIVVDATADNASLPTEHIRDKKIVLNVSYAATRALVLGNDAVSFEARFNGVPRSLRIPVDAVLGIYARENGQGMVFADESGARPPPDGTPPPAGTSPPDEPSPPDDTSPPGGRKPSLRVVK